MPSKVFLKAADSSNVLLEHLKISVHPEIVGFGSGQGLSVFATAGLVDLFRGLQKSACAVEALAKSQKRRPGPKDAVSGWTLRNSGKYTRIANRTRFHIMRGVENNE